MGGAPANLCAQGLPGSPLSWLRSVLHVDMVDVDSVSSRQLSVRPSVKRFTWREMQQYWEEHSVVRADVDWRVDPDGLGNVCHAGAPLWLNQYYARFQRQAFETLFRHLPPPRDGARALDVGCGAGRWSRYLASHGYSVTGVDLQESLVEENRRALPSHEFHCVALQEFRSSGSFDLATSVTVIQHVPPEEQKEMVTRIAESVMPGGHALILENIHDQASHVFPRSIEGWTNLFRTSGFVLQALCRYDYSPALRLLGSAEAAVSAHIRPDRHRDVGESDVPRSADPASLSTSRRQIERMRTSARRVAVSVDALLEPALMRLQPRIGTVHCGFLFRRANPRACGDTT